MTAKFKNSLDVIQTFFSNNTIADPRGMPITYTADGQVKSYHYDNEWNFASIETGGIKDTHIVSFEKTNSLYRKDIQEILYYIYFSIKQKNKIPPTSKQLLAYKLGLQHISELLEHSNWSLLDDTTEYRRFKRLLQKKCLGKSTIESNIVSVLNKLFEFDVIHHQIDGRNLVALGVEAVIAQAIAIPICMYQQILEHSIATVETYHEHRHKISDVMLEAYEKKKLNINTNNPIPHDIPNFKVRLNGVELTRIMVSCLVVVLAFSGARISEALSFNKESYEDKTGSNGNTIATLKGNTTKGNNGKPKLVTWQSHLVAKFALELAEDMTASTREQYLSKIHAKIASGDYDAEEGKKKLHQAKSAFITLNMALQKDTYVATNMEKKILSQAITWGIVATQNDVDEFNLLNPHRKGGLKNQGFLPKLSPHDFRRTFAVFFKRYNFGTSAGIMFQFKQNNINMAKYYHNNADLMRMNDVLLDMDLLNELKEADIELGVDIYDEIYNKSENLSGEYGEEIARKKRLNKLNSGVNIYMSRADIEAHVRAGDFSIVQLPTGGYCTNPECNRVCGQTIFNAEKKRCQHTVYTDKSAKILAKQRERLIAKFRGLNTGDRLKNSILAGLKQKIQDSESTLTKHKIKFEPFLDMIAGVI